MNADTAALLRERVCLPACLRTRNFEMVFKGGVCSGVCSGFFVMQLLLFSNRTITGQITALPCFLAIQLLPPPSGRLQRAPLRQTTACATVLCPHNSSTALFALSFPFAPVLCRLPFFVLLPFFFFCFFCFFVSACGCSRSSSAGMSRCVLPRKKSSTLHNTIRLWWCAWVRGCVVG